jgi:hypothetical protein
MNITNIKCENCGRIFLGYKSASRKYCSHKCANIVTINNKKANALRTKFTCIVCKKEFSLLASQVRVREKTAKIQYCGLECYFLSIKTVNIPCLYCNNPFPPKRATTKYCSVACKNKARVGKKKCEFWYENGYRVISLGDGIGRKEHLKIMEEHLGRKLEKGEVVHHKNRVTDDNRLENLELMSHGEHSRLHRNIEKETNGNKFGRYLISKPANKAQAGGNDLPGEDNRGMK